MTLLKNGQIVAAVSSRPAQPRIVITCKLLSRYVKRGFKLARSRLDNARAGLQTRQEQRDDMYIYLRNHVLVWCYFKYLQNAEKLLAYYLSCL